ncbi:hypothetical protein Tco_0180084 [Tanacetum coccineum]
MTSIRGSCVSVELRVPRSLTRLKVMASLPTRRVISPSCTSINARLVFRKHLPRIRGTRGSGSNSTTTKSAGNWNFPTNTRTSLAIPIGVVIERSASSSVMHVGVSSERERSFHTEYGIRSDAARDGQGQAFACVNAENSHGLRHLSGSQVCRQRVKGCTQSKFRSNFAILFPCAFHHFFLREDGIDALGIGVSILQENHVAGRIWVWRSEFGNNSRVESSVCIGISKEASCPSSTSVS